MDHLISLNSLLRAPQRDIYGYSRAPETIEKLKYGRFRNVYLYITDKCQLRCKHCYMGERLEHALVMPTASVLKNLITWRKLGGSKLSILGGEPSLHPDFEQIVHAANEIGYEKVILNTNALGPAAKRLENLQPQDFAYVQVSLDGGSAATHDFVRGRGTFRKACQTTKRLCERGFDTRIICTVNRANMGDCLDLLDFADEVGVSLVKYHVFSGIGNGKDNTEHLVSPREWIDFYDGLELLRSKHKCQIWYQPTYARRDTVARFAAEGYRGCIGRTLDRISIFPDGRAYVCSYLFDTTLNYATSVDGDVQLNKSANEFDLFTRVMSHDSCGDCKAPGTCNGGCPAEDIALGGASCKADADIVPVCRLWKSSI